METQDLAQEAPESRGSGPETAMSPASCRNADFALTTGGEAGTEAAAAPAEEPPAARRFTPEDAAARRAFVDEDVLDFMRRHPEMDAQGLAELEQNPQFRSFCGTRFGREPLAELYEGYRRLVENVGSAAAARERSRVARSTGGGTTGGQSLSPAQKKALDVWNAEHPEMAMTAREFLAR